MTDCLVPVTSHSGWDSIVSDAVIKLGHSNSITDKTQQYTKSHMVWKRVNKLRGEPRSSVHEMIYSLTDALTLSLSQSVGVDAWGHGADRYDVAPGGGCR